MPGCSAYLANKLNDHGNGVLAYTMPTVWIALIRATAGQSPRSIAVTTGQTTIPAAPNGHVYRCSTAGTTGTTEPTWPTTSAGTVTDGGVTWTEMTPDFQAGNSNVTASEANYTGYARAPLAGLMGASASEIAANTAAINSTTCTAGSNTIAGWMSYDALTAGNLLKFAPANSPTTTATVITPGNPVASFAIGALTTSQS